MESEGGRTSIDAADVGENRVSVLGVEVSWVRGHGYDADDLLRGWESFFCPFFFLGQTFCGCLMW